MGQVNDELIPEPVKILLDKILFWNVDTQKDFMLPSGKLYVKGAEKILPNLSKLTSLAVRKNITVVSTGDYHTLEDKEISSTPYFVNTFPSHCLAGEEGSEFVNESYPKLIHRHYFLITPNMGGALNIQIERIKDFIIYKNHFDVFEGNEYTEKILQILYPSEVIVYGVATDYCVKYAVEGILNRGYKVTIVGDAIQGIDEAQSNHLLEKWNKEGDVKVLTTEEVEKYINGNT